VSFDALSWAARQRPGSSGMKLVLLGLAECAERAHNHAFPSVASLVEFTSLDRKSVIANLSKLEAAGFIRDTSRRVGRTGQIKVYQLIIESIPKTEPSQKRNDTGKSAKGAENGTRNKSEPLSEAKASSQRVLDYWNSKAKGHPNVACARVLDNSRKQQLRLRLKEHGEAVLIEAIDKLFSSPWLLGKGRESNWKPSIDFILQPASLRKLLEGAYGEEDPQTAMTPQQQRQKLADLATFYRKIGREDDAADAERRLETLNGSAEVIPIGSAASKILGRVANA
jgi:hypothetical protein